MAKTVFDHTSIIKTILARFCRKPDGTIPDMGARVQAAQHLGQLLGETSARKAPARADYQQLIDNARTWGAALATHPILATPEGILAAPQHLTDFQEVPPDAANHPCRPSITKTSPTDSMTG